MRTYELQPLPRSRDGQCSDRPVQGHLFFVAGDSSHGLHQSRPAFPQVRGLAREQVIQGRSTTRRTTSGKSYETHGHDHTQFL
jgi:hypothetical protein